MFTQEQTDEVLKLQRHVAAITTITWNQHADDWPLLKVLVTYNEDSADKFRHLSIQSKLILALDGAFQLEPIPRKYLTAFMPRAAGLLHFSKLAQYIRTC